MKIGLINNLYKPYNVGGAEKVVEKMITNFKEAGHDVFLISTNPKNNNQRESAGLKIYYLKSNFYNLKRIPFPLHFFWHLNNIYSFKKARAIKNILITEKPDLIITHNLVGIGFRTPKIISDLNITHHHFLHDIQLLHPSGLMLYNQESRLNSLPAKIYQSLTRKLIASPKKIISPSRWLMEEHIKRGFFKNSEQEIRPCLTKNNANTLNTKEKKAHNFLFVGQVEKHKGIIFLISTFKELKNPNLRLKIIGHGNEFKAAKLVAQEDRRIEFLGYLETSKVREAMAENDYLIAPSLCYENSPTIIYEAHSVGLKVIASNIGGIPEITQENDILFEPGNQADLTKKIENII